MIIDTHSHLNFNAYKKDLDEVIERTILNEIWTVNVGSKYETSKKAVEIAQKYKEMFASIGLHPIYASSDLVKIKTDPDEGNFLIKEQDFDKDKYEQLAKQGKVVAIGEIGLDYYYKPKTKAKLEQFKQKQNQVFSNQLDLAKKLDLPVILHCRMAHHDLISVLKSKNYNLKGVVHCFTGTIDEMEEYLKLGLYIGFNGIIFKLKLDEAIKKCPLDKILVETDCPYLTPPQEGNKRNEPIFIKYVIEKIAQIKGITFKEAIKKTTDNAKGLFNLHSLI